jgi:hypothetical protein
MVVLRQARNRPMELCLGSRRRKFRKRVTSSLMRPLAGLEIILASHRVYLFFGKKATLIVFDQFADGFGRSGLREAC